MNSFTQQDLFERGVCYTQAELDEVFAGREALTLVDLLNLNIPDLDKLWVADVCEMLGDNYLLVKQAMANIIDINRPEYQEFLLEGKIYSFRPICAYLRSQTGNDLGFYTEQISAIGVAKIRELL